MVETSWGSGVIAGVFREAEATGSIQIHKKGFMMRDRITQLWKLRNPTTNVKAQEGQ